MERKLGITFILILTFMLICTFCIIYNINKINKPLTPFNTYDIYYKYKIINNDTICIEKSIVKR